MALRLCTLGRYMPSSGLSELLHVLISQAAKRRRFRQLLLVPSIMDNSHEVARADYKQCYASAKFVPLLFGVLRAEYRISVLSSRCRVCRNLCTEWNKLYRVLEVWEISWQWSGVALSNFDLIIIQISLDHSVVPLTYTGTQKLLTSSGAAATDCWSGRLGLLESIINRFG